MPPRPPLIAALLAPVIAGASPRIGLPARRRFANPGR